MSTRKLYPTLKRNRIGNLNSHNCDLYTHMVAISRLLRDLQFHACMIRAKSQNLPLRNKLLIWHVENDGRNVNG